MSYLNFNVIFDKNEFTFSTSNINIINELKNCNKINKVGVYFGNWKVYARNYTLCDLPGDKIDYLYYGFINPTSGECVLSDSWADTDRPFA